MSETPTLLTPERLEEIRARVGSLTTTQWRNDNGYRVKAYDVQAGHDEFTLADFKNSHRWPICPGNAEAELIANAPSDLEFLLALVDHYHTEWTARGTALWQREQDVEAERAKLVLLAKAVDPVHRRGPWTDHDVWQARTLAEQTLAALTLITTTP